MSDEDFDIVPKKTTRKSKKKVTPTIQSVIDGCGEIAQMNPNDLVPYENNPRLNAEAIDYVMNSIEKFGFRNPIIVDKDLVIVCGHTRQKAALKMGLEKVPVIIAKDMTPEQARAFRLADNKTAEMAGWDFDALDIELGEIGDLYDMSEFGFDTDGEGADGDFFEDTGGDDGEEPVPDEDPDLGHEVTCPCGCGYSFRLDNKFNIIGGDNN